MELGENSEDTARREVFEETGLTLGVLKLFEVGSEPVKTLRSVDQRQIVHIVYTSSDARGTLRPQAEKVLELRYFASDDLPENIFEPDRAVLEELRSRFGGEGTLF